MRSSLLVCSAPAVSVSISDYRQGYTQDSELCVVQCFLCCLPHLTPYPGRARYLVDLAGSEKVAKTGASGARLNEARKINSSLLALGGVIAALTDRRRVHVPYRNSLLTMLLQVGSVCSRLCAPVCAFTRVVRQNSFGGNSKTTLVVNCSPSSFNAHETLSTLRFGDRANHITNAPTQNQKMNVSQLKKMIEVANATLYVNSACDHTVRGEQRLTSPCM